MSLKSLDCKNCLQSLGNTAAIRPASNRTWVRGSQAREGAAALDRPQGLGVTFSLCLSSISQIQGEYLPTINSKPYFPVSVKTKRTQPHEVHSSILYRPWTEFVSVRVALMSTSCCVGVLWPSPCDKRKALFLRTFNELASASWPLARKGHFPEDFRSSHVMLFSV